MAYSKQQLEIIERRLMAMRKEYLDKKVEEFKRSSPSYNIYDIPMEWMPDEFFDPRYHHISYYGLPAKAIEAKLAYVDRAALEAYIVNEMANNGFSTVNISEFVKTVKGHELLAPLLADTRKRILKSLAELEASTKRKVDHYIEGLVLGEKAEGLPDDPAAFFD